MDDLIDVEMIDGVLWIFPYKEPPPPRRVDMRTIQERLHDVTFREVTHLFTDERTFDLAKLGLEEMKP